MITQEHKEKLKKAVESGDKTYITVAFHQVIREEIGAYCDLGNAAYDYMNLAISHITAPSKVVVAPLQPSDPAPQPSSHMVAKTIAACASLFIIACISSLAGLLLGIVLSCLVSAGVAYMHLRCKKTQPEIAPSAASSEVKVEYDADTLIETADQIADGLKQAFRIVAEHSGAATPSGTTSQPPMHKEYLDVIRCLQSIYGRSSKYNEEAREYLQESIESILDQNYYDIVKFDGGNVNKFRVNRIIGTEAPRTTLPAIVYRKTGEVVQSGIIIAPPDFE